MAAAHAVAVRAAAARVAAPARAATGHLDDETRDPCCSISLDFDGERLEEGGRQDVAIVFFAIKDPEDELDVLTLVLVACACDHAVLHDPACLGAGRAERVRTGVSERSGGATASAVVAAAGFAAAPSIFRAVAFEGGWTAAGTAGSTAGAAFEGGWTVASTAGLAASAAFAAALAATSGGTTAADGAGPATTAWAAFAAVRGMGRAAAFAGTEGGRIAASASKAST